MFMLRKEAEAIGHLVHNGMWDNLSYIALMATVGPSLTKSRAKRLCTWVRRNKHIAVHFSSSEWLDTTFAEETKPRTTVLTRCTADGSEELVDERICEVNIAERRIHPPNFYGYKHGMTQAGYTIPSGADTDFEVRLNGDQRWRRVRVVCLSNVASHFLVVDGKRLWIDDDVMWQSSWVNAPVVRAGTGSRMVLTPGGKPLGYGN